MEEITNIELIENYINGNLNGTELASFEQRMDSDPSLKSEVDFQKNVISSIQRARSVDLKMRLAAIEVSAGLSTLQKVGIAASVLILGSVIYFGITEYSTVELKEDVSEVNVVELETNLTSEVTEETVDETATLAVVEVIDESLVESTPVSEKVIDSKDVSNKAEQNPTVFTVPEIPSEEEEFISNATYEAPSGANSTRIKTVMDKNEIVVHKAAKRRGYFYKYDQENLDLYGDFDGKEYYLYELNGTGKLYLLFDNKYYEISETKSKSRLQEISDSTIIKSLNNQK